ncbi:NAD-dependent epimerase/dehydratase family protein [Chloroflexota bacterium]
MELRGRKVLVTGGAGFIGSVLTRCLVDKYNAAVSILDDLSSGDLENLSGLKVNFIKGSVVDEDLVDNCVKENEIVFHLATRNIIVSSSRPKEDYAVNIGGTLNLLVASRKYGIEKFIQASTSSIYGNPRYLPINEDDEKNFLNLYSVSKFAGECYCKVFYEMYEMSTTVVRFSNVYGKNQNPENPYCGVIAKFIEWALKGEDLQIHGDGEQTRDFTYVDDAVEATIQAALKPQSTGQVYNVGTSKEVTVNELARMIISLCGSHSRIVHIDRRDIDNIRRRVLNIERIRHDLRWIPQVTLMEGLDETIKWLKEK